jgi:hypothetical protein
MAIWLSNPVSFILMNLAYSIRTDRWDSSYKWSGLTTGVDPTTVHKMKSSSNDDLERHSAGAAVIPYEGLGTSDQPYIVIFLPDDTENPIYSFVADTWQRGRS